MGSPEQQQQQQQLVLITYSASLSFLESDHWRQLHAALVAQLPLRNLHWKSSTRPLRTIQELPVRLVPLESVRYEHTSQVPLTALERALVNIYITTCDDAETYRLSVKKQIKDWHSVVTQRKNQEWLILYLVKPDANASKTGFFSVKSSVLDKIKADFNIEKRDRCVQLAWSTGLDNPAIWADFVGRIKDGVLTAFDAAVTQREEEVRRSENQRRMPGWNFCTFFILKESLALSFEGVHLFEDALGQYDELELLFFYVLREKNLAWFGSFITPAPKDDSTPLLSINKKPYRDLILANTISVFDFRVYLLSRQSLVMARMGSIVDIARKAEAFLGAFGRRLREIKEGIPDLFVESWSYSSALNVVDQTSEWAAAIELDGSALAILNATKGELVELARTQLDIVGIKAGHLPAGPPFSMALPDSSVEAVVNGAHSRLSHGISNPDLLEAVDDSARFYELYGRISHRAIDMFVKAGRKKAALKVHGSLAALDVHRGRLASAVKTFSSLPAHYGPHQWTSLEGFMLMQALDTHAQSKQPKDRDWIHLVLNFLKAYVQALGEKLLMHEEDQRQYVQDLVASVKTSAVELDSDLVYPDHPIMEIRVNTDSARCHEDEDGQLLDISVNNQLPCDCFVDEVNLTLAGRDNERLRFATSGVTLPPGCTPITLFCPTSSSGCFVLDSSDIQISRIKLCWSHRDPRSSSRKTRLVEKPRLVHIPRDPRSLDVRIEQPRLIELGTQSHLGIVVLSGRNHVERATIKIAPPTGLQFMYQNATMDAGSSTTLEAGDEQLVLHQFSPGSHTSLRLPHSDASAFYSVKVGIHVEYSTRERPEVLRSLRLIRTVNTSLPVAVNVQDFFRDQKLFSRFTISTTSAQHVHIRSADLELPPDADDGIDIRSCSFIKRQETIVTPARPGNFVFQLSSRGGIARQSLRFRIIYRMLREEVEELLRQAVDASDCRLKTVVADALVQALDVDTRWLDRYEVTGEVDIPPLSPPQGVSEDEIEQLRQELLRTSARRNLSDIWREIIIPVDVPHMSIVAAAHLRILPQFSRSAAHISLYAGQPIPAELSIQTSFHWGSRTADGRERGYRMRFDVEEMVQAWLVSGPKRGEFLARDGQTHRVPVALIALHHGELALPKVAVVPVDDEDDDGPVSSDTHQVHGAERVLVLPRGGRTTFVVGMGGDE